MNEKGKKQYYYRKKGKRKLFWKRQKNKVWMFLVCIAFLFILFLLIRGEKTGQDGKADNPQACVGGVVMPDGEGFSQSFSQQYPERVQAFSGQDYIVMMDGIPGFNQYDLENRKGENYSELDALGRCGCAVAMLDRTMMSKEERGSIGEIKPTGWVQKKYPGIVDSQPPYLYNRCHLIAFALTGQNANEKNLITGTRYLNAEVMLPWEILVMKYLDTSNNHVLYRVTPFFQGEELVARGIEMEAYSVEDHGEGVCFHVFVYNQQPGIRIDYLTGESSPENGWQAYLN